MAPNRTLGAHKPDLVGMPSTLVLTEPFASTSAKTFRLWLVCVCVCVTLNAFNQAYKLRKHQAGIAFAWVLALHAMI